MNWWEWVFSGIGVLCLGLLIEWLRRRSRSSGQEAAITAQGARVSDSPVASGTGIVQTVEHHTHHHYTPAPAAPETQPSPAAHAPRQQSLPNIVLTGNYVARVSQVDQGVWSEHVPLQDAFIVQLTNEAQRAGPNVSGLVKAQLIYRDRGVRELRRIIGCWLNQAADMTEFRVDDTHGLMVGLMLGQQFTIIGKRRVRVDLNTDEIPQDMIALNGFEQGTVLVRLTHAGTGEVLFEGQFQLNTRPPEIIRL